MPDINLDTLFIVGLILASLFGKIFKKKEPAETEKPTQKKDSSESLEDVLREAWRKVTNPKEDFAEGPPPLTSTSPLPEQAMEIRESPSSTVVLSEINSTVKTSRNDHNPQEFWQTSAKKVNSRHGKSYRKMLYSKSSLKHAFILKEILGEPISIRRDGQ